MHTQQSLDQQMWTTNAEQQLSRNAHVETHSHAGGHRFHSFNLTIILRFTCI